jgi:aspartyl-tRNA synthetase
MLYSRRSPALFCKVKKTQIHSILLLFAPSFLVDVAVPTGVLGVLFFRVEKERLKAEKQATKESNRLALDADQNRAIPNVSYRDVTEDGPPTSCAPQGDLVRVMSQSRSGRTFARVADMELCSNSDNEDSLFAIGDRVWLRGRLQSIRAKGGSVFLVLRQNSFHTVQACYFKDKSNPEASQTMSRYLKSLTVESVIDLEGTLVATQQQVLSCSVKNVEIVIARIHAVSKAEAILPFLVEDAARSEAIVEESQSSDRPFPRLGQELRLDHRWMDLRVPANNAIMRIQSAVGQLFRESLYAQGFLEIHTPKLIAGESESGAGVFYTDYFGRKACLAVVQANGDFGRSASSIRDWSRLSGRELEHAAAFVRIYGSGSRNGD